MSNLTPVPFVYRATVTGVHDGDTVTITIDLGFDTALVGKAVRLAGINAPELRTPAGKAAQQWLCSRLVGKVITLQSFKDKTEKYGRILGDIWLDGVHINEEIVSAGHAVVWNGKGVRPV